MSNRELERSIEAILMVVEEPVSEVVLAQIIEAPTEQILESLNALAASYEEQARGFTLKQISGGWRFYSHPDLAPLVEKFVLDGQQAKLTQAALETLAATATVSDSASISAITTLINSLIAKINALNKLVIKIQKKVRA